MTVSVQADVVNVVVTVAKEVLVVAVCGGKRSWVSGQRWRLLSFESDKSLLGRVKTVGEVTVVKVVTV